MERSIALISLLLVGSLSLTVGATQVPTVVEVEQLEDNLNTVAWSLTPEEVARLDAVSEPPRMYPKWMLDFTRLDRDDPQMML